MRRLGSRWGTGTVGTGWEFMGLAMCPMCSDDEDIEPVSSPGDTRRMVRHRCGFEWEHKEPAPPKRPSHSYSFQELRARFPGPEDVEPSWLERASRLKAQYLATRPGFDPEVAAYWARYQEIFSPDGLWTCDPRALKDFANSEIGAHPGNQATFNSAWNNMGDAAAAESTRRTIEYLLYGADLPLEDRMQLLLSGAKPFAMTGFKEALLTRVLCVVRPDEFLTILKYKTDAGGKREIARMVYGLELPAPESVNWTLGRLILWSNGLLHTLVGDGFANQQHAAAFLWWAKDQPGGAEAGARHF